MAPVHARPGPVPGDVDDADRRRDLDRRSQRAQDDPDDRAPVPGRGDPGQEQPEHECIVVRAAHQGQQGQRIEQRQHERRTGIATVGPSQLRDAVGDERHAGDRHEAEQDHGDQRLWPLSDAAQPASIKKNGP